MLRGLYSAASGMMTQQRRHDTVTNNIANLNTPGYKQVNAAARAFPEMLIALVGADNPGAKSIGQLNMGVFSEESIPLFMQGDLRQTQSASDFALVADLTGADPNLVFDASGKAVTQDGEVVFKPQAFFTVRDGNGETRYTRDGKFTVNANGNLQAGDGSLVLGVDGQPIDIGDRAIGELSVNGRGEWFNATTGELVFDIEQLLITRIENPNLLIKEGNGNFRFANEEDAAAARPVNDTDDVEVRQGYLERSNVDPSQAMVDMMAAARAYEANQKVIQFYDKSLEKTVNEVGRVQ
ncbi:MULTISPECIES: flagellar hook-basal body protein [unclassified Paenibacillus]|uniref:flagellar hook-basal body protein n=1 Tax=unclassified Paenibacillus TaxID=185978 RepID=UPI001C0F53AB|nr:MULTISPECIES: flagellar hook-basal body protein [unclassified Paenibacillus]MBU5440947.1 flagellar hook-basal body protein [Paenibacillus sp. MSJ-34]CAH0118053.1 Flagellar basal-body rod protein FlgG [Paenibacillus sp. CECT 9249]